MMINDHSLEDYDYELPPSLIAQNPLIPRDSSRLLVVDSPHTQVHGFFYQLPDWLESGDLLVLNNTRVIPARLYGHKSTGVPVEVLLLEEQGENVWLALVKPGRRLKPGAEIFFETSSPDNSNFKATVVARDEETAGRFLRFELPPDQSFPEILAQWGEIPLPPYITTSLAQPDQYQTVYAHAPGAVAAPTAGLHFTEELLQKLQSQGIEQVSITLHVGVGTFRPVEVQEITTHKMHEEWIDVSPETVAKIQETKARGGRVIAVGTTVVRALEGAARQGGGSLTPFCGKTDLFIYPGYHWQVVDGMITNFHLPRSSLLMLVSAMIGRERLLQLYDLAIAENYRFYSFGDAMLILQ